MTESNEHIYTQEARNHLAQVGEGEDKKNVRDYIAQDLILKNGSDGLSFSIYGKNLNLGKVKPEHEPLLRELVTTLIVEKGVCDARLYLLAQCSAGVKGRGVISIAGGPDIEFNSSSLRPNTDILRYEALEQIFGKKVNVREMANKITEFTNNIPQGSIPLQVVEGKWKKLQQ